MEGFRNSHTLRPDTAVFNRPSQLDLSATPKPDTWRRKQESQDQGSRQGRQRAAAAAWGRAGSGMERAAQVRGLPSAGADFQPQGRSLSLTRPPPLAQGLRSAAGRLLPSGKRSLGPRLLAQQKLQLPAGAPGLGRGPARLPAQPSSGGNWRRGERGSPRKSPERSRRRPARRPSLGTKAKC